MDGWLRGVLDSSSTARRRGCDVPDWNSRDSTVQYCTVQYEYAAMIEDEVYVLQLQ